MGDLQPACGPCHDFTTDGVHTSIASVVIAPITNRVDDGKTSTSWACSKGKKCVNKNCVYSKEEK